MIRNIALTYSERRTDIAPVVIAATIEDAFGVARPSVDMDPGRIEGISALCATHNAYPVDQVLCIKAVVPAVVQSNWGQVSSCSRLGEDLGAFAPSAEEAYVVLVGPVAAQVAAIAQSSPVVSFVDPPLLLPPPRCCTLGSLFDAETLTVSFC